MMGISKLPASAQILIQTPVPSLSPPAGTHNSPLAGTVPGTWQACNKSVLNE